MTEQTTVEFWGGPADGTVLVLDGWTPPPRFAVLTSPPISAVLAELGTLDTIVPTATYRYRRETSHLDHGPLWLYVPDGEVPAR